MNENNLNEVTCYKSKTLDKFKTELYALNVWIADRFNEITREIMKKRLYLQIKNSFSYIKSKKLRKNYKVNADLVEKELTDFKMLYKIEHKEIDALDLIPILLKEKKQYISENVQIRESNIEEIL